MKSEFDIQDTWLGFEIHPETPADGVDLSGRYDPRDVAELSAWLRGRAAELGLPYLPAPMLANSSLALAGAEYARAAGRFAEFHREILSAAYARAQNIGNREVIAEAARRAGLDGAAMLKAVDEGRYQEQLRKSVELGHRMGVNSVPTFVINDRKLIVGAQPIEVFRRAFQAELQNR